MPRKAVGSSNAPIMSNTEREALQAQIDAEKAYKESLGRQLDDNATVGGLSGAEGKSVNEAKIDTRLSRMQAALAAGSPEAMGREERVIAERRAKELEGKIRPRLLTEEEQNLFPRHGYPYQRAVRKAKNGEASPAHIAEVTEYRNIQRRLHPDDPEASSIERLRAER